MVVLSLRNKTCDRYKQGQSLCYGNCHPDSVQLKEERKQVDHGNLKHQGPQEGNRSGDHTIAQRCKERGGKDIYADHQEGKGIIAERMTGHGKQLRIIAYEYSG